MLHCPFFMTCIAGKDGYLWSFIAVSPAGRTQPPTGRHRPVVTEKSVMGCKWSDTLVQNWKVLWGCVRELSRGDGGYLSPKTEKHADLIDGDSHDKGKDCIKGHGKKCPFP